MDGKTCIVTGATSGIGKEVARELARRGAGIGIVCRNRAKGKATAAELAASVPGATFEVFLADLSVLADVRKVAAQLRERYSRLDVLVNNAGLHDPRCAVSADGFDRMVAANHLGPFLLTNLLLDLLEHAASPRIVVVASEAHRVAGPLDPSTFAEPGSYGLPGSFRVYGRSKMLNILCAQELSRRLTGKVTVNSLCPGLVGTNLLRGVPLMSALISTPLLRSPADGARMPVRLAADPEFEGRSGGFYTSTRWARLLPIAGQRQDLRLQRAVWERSEQLVGLA